MTDASLLQPRSVRKYGWKPSLPGVMAQPADTSGLTLLPEVDPRKQMPPIFDQGQLGSCTANATARAFQYDAMLDEKLGPEDFLSRLWIYWWEREIEGSLHQGDTGAMGSDAFIAAAKVGVPFEKYWKYVPSKFDPAKPPASATRYAKKDYLLTKPTHLVDQTEVAIKQVLSNQQTIAFGFTVYESFEDDSWFESGIMPVPRRGEQVLGGHEILGVGYLRQFPGFLLCANSWGEVYGLGDEPGGYFLFPISVLLNRRMASDLRTIVRSTIAA